MTRPPASTEAGWRRHRFMLVLSSAVVALALLLDVTPAGHVAFRGWPNLPLPSTCMSRSLYGVDCPGCGLTRSLVYLAHGQWRASWDMHRLGWLMGAAILLQFPYRVVGLVRKCDAPLGTRLPKAFGSALIFLLIANWVVGLLA